MVGWLVYREIVVPASQTLPAAKASIMPSDYWMGIYLGEDQRAGFVNVRTRPQERDGTLGSHIAASARAQLNLFGFDADMAVTGRAWLAEDRRRADFDYTLIAGESKSRVYGELRDGQLSANLDTGGAVTPFKFPVGEDMLLGMGMGGTAMELPALEPGQEVYIDSFDPTSMSVGKAKLKCTGRETLTVGGEPVETTIIDITLGGMTTRTWIDENQETVKAQTPLGITLKKITSQEALAPIPPGERLALLESMTAVPTGAPLTRGVGEMQFRLSGLPPEVGLPFDENQRDAGGGLMVTSSPKLEQGDEQLPEEERAAALGSDPLVNWDNNAIRTLATEITGGATTDADKARALYEWVYVNIRKIPTLSVPAALDVLRTREGDCNEHTVLFTALSRATGLPCRIAIGLTYSETLGGFGYHAWPEVWLGQWVPMDPTLGQPVADATHIKLLNGGIDKWPALVSYIGKVQIEVVETSGLVDTELEGSETGEMVQ
jgi:transglutaminase-like putative cysteine protease